MFCCFFFTLGSSHSTFTLSAHCPPHSFFLSFYHPPVYPHRRQTPPPPVSFHVLFKPFLVIFPFARSLISSSFITCSTSIVSLSLIWHSCHPLPHTPQHHAEAQIYTTPISILDRRLDSPESVVQSLLQTEYCTLLDLGTLIALF